MNHFQVVSDERLAVMSKEYMPDNTKKNTDWASKVFHDWKTAATNVCCGEEGKPECPNDLLQSPNVKQINFWLSHFVAEVHNKKGESYPPTVYVGLSINFLQVHVYSDTSLKRIRPFLSC